MSSATYAGKSKLLVKEKQGVIYGTHSRFDNSFPTFSYLGLRCNIFSSIFKKPVAVHINIINNACDIPSVIIDGYANFAFLDLSRGPVGE